MPLGLAAPFPALISPQFPQCQSPQLQQAVGLQQQDCVWFSADAEGQQQEHLCCFRPVELCGDNGESWGVKTIVCVSTVLAGLWWRFYCSFFC